MPGLRVEAGRRLVEQQDLGVVDQRARDGQAPLHAPDSGSTLSLRRSVSWAKSSNSSARAAPRRGNPK
jgi:hypothetical protein